MPVVVASVPFGEPLPCTGSVGEHDLEHVTTTNDGVIRMFQANGSGVAVGDLDNDGDHDIILGNLDGPNTLLWNQGELGFVKATFGDANTRALTLVDVDADSFLDVVLTRNTGTLTYWRNTGAGANAPEGAPFERRILAGVGRPVYVLNWADSDLDGDLDLATATYDAGLLTDLGNEYLLAANGGVFAWENRDGRFLPTAL
ncbi:MAG: FG-GAP repeat domain-containing protein, partial [Caldilineaceae bacterium]